MKKHVTIYWLTKDCIAIKRIRDRFGIPKGITVNGETEADIDESDFPLLQETANCGFIQLRNK